MLSEQQLYESILERFWRLEVPRSPRAGTPPLSIGLPSNVVVFRKGLHSTKGYWEKNKYHSRYVLLVNLRTPGSVIINHRRHRFSPNQFMLVFPYQVHHYTDFQTEQVTWIHITFDLPTPGELALLRDAPPMGLNKRALAALNRILACSLCGRRGPRSNELVLNAALLLNELLSQHKRRSRPLESRPEELIEQVGQFVDAHLSEGVRIERLAHHMGYSASRLRAVFRARTGMSLGKYIVSSCMARALQLVETTDMNISEIAYACGYESPAAFSRLFKKHIGRNPRDHRREREACFREPTGTSTKTGAKKYKKAQL